MLHSFYSPLIHLPTGSLHQPGDGAQALLRSHTAPWHLCPLFWRQLQRHSQKVPQHGCPGLRLPLSPSLQDLAHHRHVARRGWMLDQRFSAAAGFKQKLATARDTTENLPQTRTWGFLLFPVRTNKKILHCRNSRNSHRSKLNIQKKKKISVTRNAHHLATVLLWPMGVRT